MSQKTKDLQGLDIFTWILPSYFGKFGTYKGNTL